MSEATAILFVLGVHALACWWIEMGSERAKRGRG